MVASIGLFANIGRNQQNWYKHYKVAFQDRHEYTKPNINALIEKWMPCDMFWTPRIPGSKYIIRLKGNESIILRELKEKKSLLPNPYENL
jgi:hypothetical protein